VPIKKRFKTHESDGPCLDAMSGSVYYETQKRYLGKQKSANDDDGDKNKNC